MNAAQARDHIEMVARILDESQQRLCTGGEFFLVWGLYSGLATLVFHFVNSGRWPVMAVWGLLALLAACIAFSVVRGRFVNAANERRSLVQREFFHVLWLTIGLSFVANVAAFHIFVGLSSAAIWSFSEAIVLFYIALHGNRRAMLAGIAVVISLVAANFAANDLMAYLLAGGLVGGYGGFGIAELLSRE